MVFINYNNKLQKINNKFINITEFKNYIQNKYSLNSYYLVCNNKLLTKYNYSKLKYDDTIDINIRIKGGIMDILEPIFGPILNPFKDMILAIVDIAALVIEVIALFPKVLKMIPALFSPDKLLNDVIYGTINGINSMLSALFEKMNFLGGEKNDTKNDGSGGAFGIDDTKKAVCVKPTLINLIILVLCPPLALYIERGGFFLVIICGLMTYFMYYFPGFLFAALHILH